MRGLIILFLFIVSGKSICQTSSDSLDLMIGQMIMIGIGDFAKTDLSQPIFSEIKEGKIGGVVLYEKNIYATESQAELAKLVISLQQGADIPLFIGIDEEGGYVSRLKSKYGFPESVSAQWLGEVDNIDSTRFYANQTARLLQNFGINMNYAPVLDVNLNPNNPVIGNIKRSFSENYEEVSKHAFYVIEEHTKNNVVTVLKHFPGHGSSKNDTHLGLTDVTASWQFEEIYPYKSMLDSGAVKSIMTAHIVNETLDPSKLPATLSSKVINGILREFLGYNGVVISDDMQMGAIKNEFGTKEAISRSINAGVDLLMFANNVRDYDMVTGTEVHSIIKELISEGHISEERIRTSYNRIMKLKNEFGLLDQFYFDDLKMRLDRY